MLDANVMTALGAIILAGYIHYAKQVLEKLVAILGEEFSNDMKKQLRDKKPPD